MIFKGSFGGEQDENASISRFLLKILQVLSDWVQTKISFRTLMDVLIGSDLIGP